MVQFVIIRNAPTDVCNVYFAFIDGKTRWMNNPDHAYKFKSKDDALCVSWGYPGSYVNADVQPQPDVASLVADVETALLKLKIALGL